MKCLSIMATHFFDDFVTFCREGEEQLANMTVHNFFSLLGWGVSEDKDKEFGREFGARFLLKGICMARSCSRTQRSGWTKWQLC